MDDDKWFVAGISVLAGFAAGILLGKLITRNNELVAESDRATRKIQIPNDISWSLDTEFLSSTSDSVIADLRRQETAVRNGVVKLTLSLGTPGADQIGLTGRIAGVAAELTKLESRRHLAEADAAAITFPGKAKIDQLRIAVGELEAAIDKAVAAKELLAKTSAAIDAWKA